MTGGGNRNGNNNDNVTSNDSAGDDCDRDKEDDVFRADPLLPALERGEQDEYFSLGLVVNWPLQAYHAPNRRSYDTENDDDDSIGGGGGGGDDDDDDNSSFNNNHRHQPLQEHYESFCSRVQAECFSRCQNREDDFDDKSSTILFLPLESLHITVATLMSARKTTKNDFQKQQQQQQHQQDEIVRRWKELLVRASQHEGWPKTKKLQLKIRGALITESAGILLWDDLSNGISKIRQCLHSVVKDEKKREQKQKQKRHIAAAGAAGGATQHDNNNHHDSSSSKQCTNDGFMDGFRTPDIIHTTFMRYRTPPPSGQSPSAANSILQRNIVCTVGNDRNDNCNHIPHPLFHQQTSLQRNAGPGTTEPTSNDVETVEVDCAKMVNCKIYLQPRTAGLMPKTFDNDLCNTVDDEIVKGVNNDRDDDDNTYHEVYLTLPIGSGSIP